MERENIPKHRRIIAHIFIVLGFLSLAFGIITLNAFQLVEEWFRPNLPQSINLGILTIHNPFQWFVIFPMINLIVALFKLITGFGILNDKSWASKLSLVIAFFWFFQFPLGTAFSVYILYSFLDYRAANKLETEETSAKTKVD